jgi:subtilase family serine protease
MRDPSSPLFRKGLTPDEFEQRFGMSDDDLNTITGWFASHGFTVDEVGKGRRWINFSGTVAQVERAFHTEMRKYSVDGEVHHANATPPAIPRALEGAVKGVVSLHDFPMKSQANPTSSISPSGHALAPMDFAKIYNTKPLLDLGITGKGVSIAIVGRSLIDPNDVLAFRNYFNLPAPSWSEAVGPPSDPASIFRGGTTGTVVGGTANVCHYGGLTFHLGSPRCCPPPGSFSPRNTLSKTDSPIL